MNKLLSLLIIHSLVFSCASTTVITTSDPEAKIYDNDKLLGVGTAVYTDRSLSWSSQNIIIKKDNCTQKVFHLKRNEKLDPLALVTGIFLIVPLLWIMRYEAKHHYPYACKS